MNIPVIDHPAEETVEPNSHHIPPYNSHEYHRSHVELLQRRFVSTSHGYERDCHVGSEHAISKGSILTIRL